MKKIITIGELLIDFMPNEKGYPLKSVDTFIKRAGGAPANVAVAASILGSEAIFLGQVGKDAFGDFLKDTLNSYQVNTTYLEQSDAYKTALAFVSLTKEGERDFIFYRNPSADQFYQANTFDLNLLDHNILHFCSVSLLGYPIKDTHIRLLKEAQNRGTIISFDPNVRLALASNYIFYQETIRAFLPYANILKVSDDELSFITGKSTYETQVAYLLSFKPQVLIITKGAYGISLYVDGTCRDIEGFKVNVVDTTGAGDSWIGSFLHQIAQSNLDLKVENLAQYALFSNAYAALTTTKIGAMDAMPTKQETIEFMHKKS